MLEESRTDPRSLLHRHATGDWGELDAEDVTANAMAVYTGSRILSAYTVNGFKLWVITEADRSSTRSLLPSEH